MCDVVCSLKCRIRYKLNFKLQITQTIISNVITEFALIAFKLCWQNFKETPNSCQYLRSSRTQAEKKNHHKSKSSGLRCPARGHADPGAASFNWREREMRAEPALGENNVRRMNTRSLRNASPQPDTCASGSLNCLARCGRRKSYTLPHTHDVFCCPSCAHSSRGALGDPLRSPVLGQLGVPGRRILCRVHTPSLLPASRYSRTATEGTAGGCPANQGGLWRRHTETWLEPRGSTAPPTCRPPASLSDRVPTPRTPLWASRQGPTYCHMQ